MNLSDQDWERLERFVSGRGTAHVACPRAMIQPRSDPCPARLTAIGRESLLEEWEVYAGLLLQGKPVELFYLPDAAHVLTKPWEQLASEQGAVDWYRFWLKGEEDLDPAKREQYARWRELREMRSRARPPGRKAGDTSRSP